MLQHLTQKFEYETNSVASLERVLQEVVEAFVDRKLKCCPRMFAMYLPDSSVNEPKYKYDEQYLGRLDSRMWEKPTYFRICSVNDYNCEIKKADETFDDPTQLVQRVMERVRMTDTKTFFEVCGSGSNSGEPSYSIAVGYRLSLNGRRGLDVSLCHLYYGK